MNLCGWYIINTSAYGILDALESYSYLYNILNMIPNYSDMKIAILKHEFIYTF